MIGLQTTKKFLSVALFVAVGAATLNIGRAQAIVLTFDDITTSQTQIPNGYKGFNWNNFFVLNTPNYSPLSGFQNGTVSSPNVAYNGYGNPATVSVGSGTFNFNSAYLTGVFNDGLQILVEGFLNGNLKNSQTVTVNTTNPTKFNFNYSGIDTLNFTSSGGSSGTHFALDNFEYNAQPVPEPLTIVGTMAAGSIGVAMRRKFKKQQKDAVKV